MQFFRHTCVYFYLMNYYFIKFAKILTKSQDCSKKEQSFVGKSRFSRCTLPSSHNIGTNDKKNGNHIDDNDDDDDEDENALTANNINTLILQQQQQPKIPIKDTTNFFPPFARVIVVSGIHCRRLSHH